MQERLDKAAVMAVVQRKQTGRNLSQHPLSAGDAGGSGMNSLLLSRDFGQWFGSP
jgi:hypothetical protein